jgi:hypothetical protein
MIQITNEGYNKIVLALGTSSCLLWENVSPHRFYAVCARDLEFFGPQHSFEALALQNITG